MHSHVKPSDSMGLDTLATPLSFLCDCLAHAYMCLLSSGNFGSSVFYSNYNCFSENTFAILNGFGKVYCTKVMWPAKGFH